MFSYKKAKIADYAYEKNSEIFYNQGLQILIIGFRSSRGELESRDKHSDAHGARIFIYFIRSLEY